MSRFLNPSELERFKALLQDYQPNNEVLEQFRNSKFAVIAGPAGAGKDTLRIALIENYPELYMPILSTTTRPPRIGELDGDAYHFREIADVEQSLRNRELFQVILVHNQQISGLHVDEIKKLGSGQTGLSILITETEKMFRAIKPDMKTIFLIPPDLETLLIRIQSERRVEKSEIDRRLQAAKNEIAYALQTNHYYCLISDTVDHVLDKGHKYLEDGEKDGQSDKEAREVMQKIMLELADE